MYPIRYIDIYTRYKYRHGAETEIDNFFAFIWKKLFFVLRIVTAAITETIDVTIIVTITVLEYQISII